MCLGEVLHKTVAYQPQNVEKFEQDYGKPRAQFFEYLRNGFFTRCSSDYYNLTGRQATNYHDYLVLMGPFGRTGLQELFSDSGVPGDANAAQHAPNLKTMADDAKGMLKDTAADSQKGAKAAA